MNPTAKGVLAVVLIALCSPVTAQTGRTTNQMDTTNEKPLLARVAELENKAALRELVDTFSILADKKETDAQTRLFSRDATVETLREGKVVSSLKGTQQIGDAFARFLKNFDTVYHMNGQHNVTITGDRANGTLYCLVYLFRTENGKRLRTTMGATYKDEYTREAGKWLIARRTSRFEFTVNDEVP
jgi:hypothetical protein